MATDNYITPAEAAQKSGQAVRDALREELKFCRWVNEKGSVAGDEIGVILIRGISGMSRMDAVTEDKERKPEWAEIISLLEYELERCKAAAGREALIDEKRYKEQNVYHLEMHNEEQRAELLRLVEHEERYEGDIRNLVLHGDRAAIDSGPVDEPMSVMLSVVGVDGKVYTILSWVDQIWEHVEVEGIEPPEIEGVLDPDPYGDNVEVGEGDHTWTTPWPQELPEGYKPLVPVSDERSPFMEPKEAVEP